MHGSHHHALQSFAIYGFIGLSETMALFAVGEAFDHRRQRRDYAPEWK
jgi:hypothetical protein